ncbi:MAG: hydantoinase/oxoprolinase family protein [Gemmatimonadetes bacterium]|nr:hydantoinase/oxoprolinase family protein [Gemmatimonadota bacterium]
MSTGPSGPSTPLVAVDTGGTFTDLVLLQDGVITTLKVPSTPADPSRAVLEGLRRLVPPGTRFELVHGSTVATNALLERRGARVVLVTNRGFEDVIEIGRQNRPQLYALVGHRLPPLVARDDRVGVAGRLGPLGEQIEPLDEGELAQLAARVRSHPPESIAVALLHAYANPAHEEAVARVASSVGVPVSVSSAILPEFREYERTSTTVVNAYVAPIVDRYLGRLAADAGAERVRIMGSNGGALPIERARSEPVHTVLSGPAGGLVGALTWARRAGYERAISFDMGGTSTDVSLLPGRALRTREFEISGVPVAIPVLDIHTVGAGGGSIARVDPGGSLRVGPQSAGADPGPICYGRGGTDVTVTDAHVWLGRLPVDAFLDGERKLDRESVRAPLTGIAGGLGSSLEDAAEGVIAVADAAMERALRVISVERGYDPVDFVLVAFGGAGGLHVAELTARLGARSAILPPDPGLLSAYGMLASPVTREVSRTILVRSDTPDAATLVVDVLHQLERAARDAMVLGGADARDLATERWIDARYVGQSFELAVPADGWLGRFHEVHQARYGYARSETPVEAVTARVVVSAPAPALPKATLAEAEGPSPMRAANVTHAGTTLRADRVRRRDLRAGHRLAGPVIVQEYSGTTWVPPEWVVGVDPSGNLHLGMDL